MTPDNRDARLAQAAEALLDIAKRYVALYPGASGQPRAFFDRLFEDALALVTTIEPESEHGGWIWQRQRPKKETP